MKCRSRGGTGQFCDLELGHDGGHMNRSGPGCSIWFSDFPRWGKDGDGVWRWIKPDEACYSEPNPYPWRD